MLKKLTLYGLAAMLLAAAAVGVYDFLRGDSALAYRGVNDDTPLAADGSRFDSTRGNAGAAQRNDAPLVVGSNGFDGGTRGNAGIESRGIAQANDMAASGGGFGDSTQGNAGAGNRGAGQASQTGDAQPQALVDEWLTVSGVIASIDDTAFTVETDTGESVLVQLGPAHFMASQKADLKPGDAVQVLGFYEDETFTAGDVQLSTGEHIVLRDPNGRPLWAGGPASSAGSSNQRPSTGSSGDDLGYGGQGTWNGQSPTDGKPQAMYSDWITVQGTVLAVELNALIIETTDGQTMPIQLGPEHFWAAQGFVIEAGAEVQVTGFYEDEVSFSAGQVTLLDTSEILSLRDADGRPLWSGGAGNGGSGDAGNDGDGSIGYRSGR